MSSKIFLKIFIKPFSSLIEKSLLLLWHPFHSKTSHFLVLRINLVFNRFEKIHFSNKLIILYLATSFLFIIIHERHLNSFIILLLAVSAFILSGILITFTLYIIREVLNKNNSLVETGAVLLITIALYFTGFIQHKSGVIFLFFVYAIILIFKLTGLTLYFKTSMIGLLIMANSILTFSFLQFSEVFSVYQINKNRYGKIAEQLETWDFDKNTRKLTNEALGIELSLPKEMYFFQPKDLDLNNKTGAGNILLSISSSDKNPSRYPYIRLFYLTLSMDNNQVNQEFRSYLDILTGRKDIEELKELADHNLLEKNWNGRFWIYYDNIQPRYARTGYYLVTLNSGKLLIQITENLLKDKYHEDTVADILKSIKIHSEK